MFCVAFSYDEQLHKVDERVLTVSFDLTTQVLRPSLPLSYINTNENV